MGRSEYLMRAMDAFVNKEITEVEYSVLIDCIDIFVDLEKEGTNEQ